MTFNPFFCRQRWLWSHCRWINVFLKHVWLQFTWSRINKAAEENSQRCLYDEFCPQKETVLHTYSNRYYNSLPTLTKKFIKAHDQEMFLKIQKNCTLRRIRKTTYLPWNNHRQGFAQILWCVQFVKTCNFTLWRVHTTLRHDSFKSHKLTDRNDHEQQATWNL